MSRALFLGLWLSCADVHIAAAEAWPARGALDSRIRTAPYSADQVYRLPGHVGYQIDLQFEAGEHFVGLGAGDMDALSFSAQDNHLFIKPRATPVKTNLTVLTNRRHYQFEYSASAKHPDPFQGEVIYALRFSYPPGPAGSGRMPDNAVVPPLGNPAAGLANNDFDAQLDREAVPRPINIDYWYGGHPALKPVAASDDGIHTRLRFGARSEQPAIFVRNDDGTESLLNFSMDVSDVILHRVVGRLIVRRGKIAGCIVNKGFEGSGTRLESGTVATGVKRSTRRARP